VQKIILASGSKRRQELLERLGLQFEVVESGYDEDKIRTDDPVELVEELALQKALQVAKLYPDAIVIGGDTTVYVAGELVGKPRDKTDATRIMRLLSGTTHLVVSGVAVVNSLTGDQYVGHEEAAIRFKQLTDDEISEYVKSEKWRGFAGGYAIQGAASPFISDHNGKISTIIGFPLTLVVDLLEQMGVSVPVQAEELEQVIKDEKIGVEGQ
jgi:septum formation protein